ncbi:hypothetical protein ABZX77_05745 [Streptomyces sp. NPDC004237]|uniref:hypothetical protein n=1 Tax=Streptomyces sp. NPDC004237 TaxID=3154455 RepID=UPI0033A4A79F
MLRATWSSGTSTRELRLAAENRSLRDLLATLTDRLEDLQRANERMYAADYDRAGGPSFDRSQPFGSEPARPLGTLPMKGGAS